MARWLFGKWKALPRNLRQFVKFGLVGVSNTAIGLGVNYLLLAFGVHYLLSNALGFIAGVINAYCWNSRFVFAAGEKACGRAFIKFFISYGATFLLSLLLNYLMVEHWSVPVKAAPILVLLFTVPSNFLLNKHWAFK